MTLQLQDRQYTAEGLAINISLNGLPGIILHAGRSPVAITFEAQFHTHLHISTTNTEPVSRNYTGPYTMTQVLLKPHALHTLLGINATALTHGLVTLDEFSIGDLNDQHGGFLQLFHQPT
jgi:hypothetical protein